MLPKRRRLNKALDAPQLLPIGCDGHGYRNADDFKQLGYLAVLRDVHLEQQPVGQFLLHLVVRIRHGIHAFARQSARPVERQQQRLAIALGLLHFLPQLFGKAGQVSEHLSSRLRACSSVFDDLPPEPLLAYRFQHPLRRDMIRVEGNPELVLLQINFQRRDSRKP